MSDAPQTFRDLPSVDEVAAKLADRFPHKLAVAETRRVLAVFRDEIRGGRSPARSVEEVAAHNLETLMAPSLRPVINATGVVLHTNLGRAPLGRETFIAGYSNLEYDLVTGRRGRRDAHLAALLESLLGASAIAVNNNAAAVFLALHELAAGVDLVSFSGDKLLGGPQAGILAGRTDLVARLRLNPMFRALRLDKLIIESLADTLRAILLEDYAVVPALGMIMQTADRIRERAERLAVQFGRASVVEGRSVIGGGSTPDQSLCTWLVAFDGDAAATERALRAGDPPVIARIHDGHLVVDLRTVAINEEEPLAAALQSALRDS